MIQFQECVSSPPREKSSKVEMLASSLRLSCVEEVWRTTNFQCTCIHNTAHSIAAIRVMVLVHMSRCDPLVPRRLSMPIQTHLLPPLVALVEVLTLLFIT